MSKDSGKTISVVVLIVFATILTRFLVAYCTNYTADDSFITFRYAENVAAGKGFVYNEGERVLGTSTPLYTLVLALLLKSGLPIVLLTRIVNIAADCLTSTLIFLLLRQFRWGVGILAALFYVLFPRVMVWSVSGMETSLFVLLVVGTLYFYVKRKFDLAALFLGLTLLTRMEGAILGFAILVDFIFRYKAFPGRMVLWAGGVVLPWFVFSFLYFGSPVTNAVPGKRALYTGTILQTPQWSIFREFLFLRAKIGWPLLVLSLAGIYRIATQAKSYAIIPFWTLTYFLLFLFAGTRMHMWYYVPFYAGYLILVVFGLGLVWEKIKGVLVRLASVSSVRGRPLVAAKTLVAVSLAAVLIVAGLVYVQQMKRTFRLAAAQQVGWEDVHKGIGLWLAEHTQPDDTISAEDIGYLGYYSRRYILDHDGIVSPQAIPFNKNKDRLGLIRSYQPAFCVIGFAEPYYSQVTGSEWFRSNYQLEAIFDESCVRADRARVSLEDFDFAVCEYNIYKRTLYPD